jgi:hypothetical protein
MPAGRALGLGFQIGDHADDVFGDQSANRTAGIDSVQDLAVRRQQEPRRLKIARRLVGIRPGDGRYLVSIGAMAERKTQLEFFDRADRRGFVVNGQRDNLDARFGELFARTLKARELSLTVRTPCPPIE